MAADAGRGVSLRGALPVGRTRMTSETRTDSSSIDPRPLVDTQRVLLSAQALFARKWCPVILHRLLVDGPVGFNDLERSVDDISGKMLSESLAHLEDEGLVDRRLVSERPVRVEYAPTERGEALAPAIRTLLGWGREHVTDATREVSRPSGGYR